MKALKWIVVGVAIAILALLTIVLSQLMVGHAPPKIQYSDLLMIVLTVLSIMITVLGLVKQMVLATPGSEGITGTSKNTRARINMHLTNPFWRERHARH